MILVFGGTTEGIKTAEILDFIGEPYFYSTKTDVRFEMQGKPVSGEMDAQKIVAFCSGKAIRLIIDAAHPFAVHLHRNIHEAAIQSGISVLRYEREYPATKESDNVTCFDSFGQLSEALLKSKFQRILSLTGVQTIPALKSVWEKRICYFRVLDTPLSKKKAGESGIPAEYIIPMAPSGAVDELHQLAEKTKAEILLSKESGTSGFIEIKKEVSRKLGVPLWTVKRPSLPDFDLTVYSGKQLLQQIYTLRKTILKEEGVLRSGFTTGTCVTAAAKACFMALAEGIFPKSVEVTLPGGERTSFLIFPESLSGNKASCTVIKNGGDDPDITHGKEIGCELTRTQEKGIRFLQGKGIGKVTLPGLQLAVGEPAINPAPRQMISSALDFLSEEYETDTGFELKPFVPEGETLAGKTFNPRVGVTGGISIIGTTGKVTPYSNEAFLSTIRYQFSVAHESGFDEVVLTSGRRSENMLRPVFPHLQDPAFIHFGNLVGESVKMAVLQKIRTINLGIMLGKAIKLAAGNLDTHSRESAFDPEFAVQIARNCGYNPEVIQKISQVILANAIRDILPFSQTEPFYLETARRCFQGILKITGRDCSLRLYLLTEKGEMLVCEKDN